MFGVCLFHVLRFWCIECNACLLSCCAFLCVPVGFIVCYWFCRVFYVCLVFACCSVFVYVCFFDMHVFCYSS